jgi:hypothetical protein
VQARQRDLLGVAEGHGRCTVVGYVVAEPAEQHLARRINHRASGAQLVERVRRVSNILAVLGQGGDGMASSTTARSSHTSWRPVRRGERLYGTLADEVRRRGKSVLVSEEECAVAGTRRSGRQVS